MESFPSGINGSNDIYNSTNNGHIAAGYYHPMYNTALKNEYYSSSAVQNTSQASSGFDQSNLHDTVSSTTGRPGQSSAEVINHYFSNHLRTKVNKIHFT